MNNRFLGLTAIITGTFSAALAADASPAALPIPAKTVKMDEPHGDFAAVTPSDSSLLSVQPCNGIYVGSGGNLVVQSVTGNQVTFIGVPEGTLLPIRAIQVYATNKKQGKKLDDAFSQSGVSFVPVVAK